MSRPAIAEMLAELRAIRDALEASQRVAHTYEQAARRLGCSKRSVERLIAEKRLTPRDIGGPKIPESQLRELADGDLPKRRGRARPKASGGVRAEADAAMAKIRERMRGAQ